MFHQHTLKQIHNIAKRTITKQPLVVISTLSYNHEPYIREALEGFVMQKTDFPFVAVVHDDASTDNTADIIREYAEKYPDIILPIYETENQYSKKDGSLGRIMHAAREATGAKYVAFCEGDDYWTDPLKLQKQVDFLESHPDYGLVCSRYNQYILEENRFLPIHPCPDRDIAFEDLLLINRICTATVCIKKEILDLYNHYIAGKNLGWSFGDYPIWIFASSKMKVRLLGEYMAVYRILGNSASHFSSLSKKLRWIQTEYEVFDTLSNLAPLEEETIYKAEYNRARQGWYIAAQAKNKELLFRILSFYKQYGFGVQAQITRLMYYFPFLKSLWFRLDNKFAPQPWFYKDFKGDLHSNIHKI